MGSTKEIKNSSRAIIANSLWQLWINRNDCHYRNHQSNYESLRRNLVAATTNMIKQSREFNGAESITLTNGNNLIES